MSTFGYNNVELQMVRTLMFKVDRAEDPSGSDHKWNVYEMRVRGFVILTGDPTKTSPFAGLGCAAKLAAIKAELEVPRRPLYYEVGGVQMVRVVNGPDADLGPKPTPAQIHVQQMTENVFMVEWGGVVCLADCRATGGGTSPVVSLRWSQQEAFDENWYSRVVTKGRLIVRSDLLKNADQFRELCVPPVLPDYRRLSSSYTLDPKGTELEFEFVDQEQDMMPPREATTAEGQFIVTIEKGGAKRVGQVDLKLTGPKGQERSALLTRALAIAYTKMANEGMLGGVLSGRVVENLYKPEVQVSIQGNLAPVGAAFEGIGGIARRISRDLEASLRGLTPPPDVMLTAGFTPGANGMVFVPPGGVGSGVVLPNPPVPGIIHPIRKRLVALLAAGFRDPCLASPLALLAPRGGPIPPPPGPPGGAPVTADPAATFTIAPLPPLPAGVSSVADLAPYDEYLIESAYVFDTGYVQMPGTGVGADGHKSAVVKVSGGMMTLEVSWTATRQGTPPVLPSFFTSDTNCVPLRAAELVSNVDVSADGRSPRHSVSGHYSYAVIDPTLVQMQAPRPPFLSALAQQASNLAPHYRSDGILWGFQGATGNNPFVSGGTVPGEVPNNNLAVQLGEGAIAGYDG